MKKKYILYIVIFLAVCLIPSAGLIFSGAHDSAESQDVAQKPVLIKEDGFNERFISDAGAYFEDHFAFRNKWVTGYAFLADKLFGVSAQDGVITGTDGWLYYKDSLENYQGANQLTDRQLFDIAHSLALVQQYAEENGVDFAFAVAPNKNTLYGEHMPYYYRYFRSEGSNLARLLPYLEAENVNYVDLYGLFSAQDEVLYHKRDSHWNNKGASMAADAILTGLGREHISYADRKYVIRKDYEGDLDGMLYPAAVTKENEIYFDPLPQFSYVEDVESNFEPKISTLNEGVDGSLVMYRDSFGNALLPFMAEAFGNAYFSRGVPYQLSDLDTCEADTLVIERAERFLPDMAANAPVMEAPLVLSEIPEDAEFSEDLVQNLEITDWGDFTEITGSVPPEKLKVDSRLYVRVNDQLTYEAFPVSLADGREGFQFLISADTLYGEDDSFSLYIGE